MSAPETHVSAQASSAVRPVLRTAVPGPASRALALRLGAVESRNVTCLAPHPPIFWERAEGAHVIDVDGNRFIDLTAAFGVANVGHTAPEIVRALAEQAGSMIHGMGDVHPSRVKVELLEALVARYPGGEPARAVLGSSGSDAVETAIKTAMLATGRAGIVAFEGGYHGLAFGPLDATARDDFRSPFAARLPGATWRARFGDIGDVVRQAEAAEAAGTRVGAVLVEPVQGRGGERVAPPGFLRALRTLCDERGWLLIADEIYTGFGRTGRLFACEHEGVVPDLLCVGKGLASGMPISACIGRESVMRAWPASTGEALHTQTFLGHPLGCAAACASIATLERDGLVERAAVEGARILAVLRERLAAHPAIVEVRGLGLMIGVEFAAPSDALAVCTALLEAGVIVLPSGARGEVVSLTPPLTIARAALDHAVDLLVERVEALAGS